MYGKITRTDLEGFLLWCDQPSDDPEEKQRKRELEEYVQEAEGIGVAEFIRNYVLKEEGLRFCPLQRAAFLNAWIIKYGDENYYRAAKAMDKGHDVERPYIEAQTCCDGERCAWYDRDTRDCAVLIVAVKGDGVDPVTESLLGEVEIWKSK